MFKRWRKKRRLQADLDVDEVFIDSFQLTNKNLKWEHRLEFLISARPVRWFTMGMLAVLVLFGGRLLYLETVLGQELTTQATRNHIKTVWDKSPRGIVYDHNHTALVANESSFDLVAIPAELPRERDKQEQIITLLQHVFALSRDEVLELFEKADRFSYQPIPLATNITREELIQLQNALKDIKGIRVEENFVRNYPENGLFSHVLGYAGLISPEEYKDQTNGEYLLTDAVGKSGIEQHYEGVLRGTYGKTEYEVNSQGREQRVLGTTAARPGKNVVLYLDAALQQKVTEVMQETLARKGLSAGAVVALDPSSGGILALQSFPTFDHNIFSGRLSQEDVAYLFQNEDQPLFNRAVSGLYPPGSTIKPFLAAGGLEEGVIDENTTVLSTDYITIGNQRFHDWRAHGIVDVRRALGVSSNIFFYILGGGYEGRDGLGIYRIKEYLEKFHLAGPFGIDLPGEQTGIIPSPEWKEEHRDESWYIGDTYNTSIGQGYVSVTPLSLAMAMASIVNNGTLLRPRMVASVTGTNFADPEYTTIDVIDKDFISDETLQIVQEGMRESVLSGYNKVLQDLPVAVAGKTGTAQNIPGQSEHSWYVTYAPYEDPEIVIAFLIEHGGLGTDSVMPVAKEVLNWYFAEHKPR